MATKKRRLLLPDAMARPGWDLVKTRADVEAIAPECASRLHRVLTGYQPVIDVLTSQPRSLVHGGYIPWHILLDARCQPTRVCAIDWELAALGSTLYDLALFADDAEPPVRAGT
mgnify:CR=1 FL=1